MISARLRHRARAVERDATSTSTALSAQVEWSGPPFGDLEIMAERKSEPDLVTLGSGSLVTANTVVITADSV